jgi:hypothetical protein
MRAGLSNLYAAFVHGEPVEFPRCPLVRGTVVDRNCLPPSLSGDFPVGSVDEIPSVTSDPSCYFKMFTARAITSPRRTKEAVAWTAIANLAQCLSGMTSVGLNAVALVNPR